MTATTIQAAIGLAVLAGAAALVLTHRAHSLACGNSHVLDRVIAAVNQGQGESGLIAADPQRLAGGLFGPKRCSVLLTTIRTSTDLTAAPWSRVRYTVPLSASVYTPDGSVLPPTGAER